MVAIKKMESQLCSKFYHGMYFKPIVQLLSCQFYWLYVLHLLSSRVYVCLCLLVRACECARSV